MCVLAGYVLCVPSVCACDVYARCVCCMCGKGIGHLGCDCIVHEVMKCVCDICLLFLVAVCIMGVWHAL